MRLYFFFPFALALTSTAGFSAVTDSGVTAAPLAITQATHIPGETLKPGEYSVTIVDQLADRSIVRIDSTNSTRHTIFLGVTGRAVGTAIGPVLWEKGLDKAPTLRGFNFAGGTQVEFVYGKAEAAALAKDNSAKVIAIDPQSEGRSNLKSLSKDELQEINLWMLSLTTTGADNKTPAVLAQRYQEPVMVAATTPARVEVPAPQVAVVESAPIQASVSGGASRNPRRRSVIAQLPHTGSELPLLWGLGIVSLFTAGLLRLGWALTTRRSVT